MILIEMYIIYNNQQPYYLFILNSCYLLPCHVRYFKFLLSFIKYNNNNRNSIKKTNINM